MEGKIVWIMLGILICSLMSNIYLFNSNKQLKQAPDNDYYNFYKNFPPIRLNEMIKQEDSQIKFKAEKQETLKIPLNDNCEPNNNILISKSCLNFTKDNSVLMSWEWQ